MKVLYRVSIEIDPNRERLRVTTHAIQKEFKEEIVVTAEEGGSYIHRVPPGDIGSMKDHSSAGGWLELDIWLRDPSEVETAKRLLMSVMEKKIRRYEDEAAKLRRKYETVKETAKYELITEPDRRD